MESRERIKRAVRRQKTDRPATSLRCTAEVWDALCAHFQVNSPIDALDALDIDLRWVSVPYIGPKNRSAVTLFEEGVDIWGNRMAAITNKYNTYYEIVEHPLAHVTDPEQVFAYDWPSLDWWDYEKITTEIAAHKKNGDRAILYFAGGAFETPWYMRGLEQFMFDLVENPQIVEAICQHVADYYINKAMRVLESADGQIDIIGSGGDIGSQHGLIIGPDLWREQIKKHSARLITPFRDLGLDTFYHSCGSITPVIQDLIELGLQILDPIQITAKGMDPETLSKRFANRICFHGAIDEVELLPHATPKQVYDETIRIISVLGKQYGYIVSPTHQVQADTDIENILALFQAARDTKY